MIETYTQYAWQMTRQLLDIPSPTGYTRQAAAWVKTVFENLGFSAVYTHKGGVLVDLGGRDGDNGLLLLGHIDTIGAMVAQVKDNGRLRLTPLGGLHPESTEGENVTLFTRDGQSYEGTCQLINPSVHVNTAFSDTKREYTTMELVLDEPVASAEAVKALGIANGDIVSLDPRARLTRSGYIKSRFLDDKLCVGILMALAKYLADNHITPERKVYLHLTVYEEVGHGGSASVPAGVTDAVALDMGCVGEGLEGSEEKVSICAKDAGGPYSYELTTRLIQAAQTSGANYAVDVYPRYGSDVEATVRGGADIRHGLIGPGVFASHGYERSHLDGVRNTLLLLKAYLGV